MVQNNHAGAQKDANTTILHVKHILHPATSSESSAIIDKVLKGSDLHFFAGEIDCCVLQNQVSSLLDENSLHGANNFPGRLSTYFSIYLVRSGKDRIPKYAVSHISLIK